MYITSNLFVNFVLGCSPPTVTVESGIQAYNISLIVLTFIIIILTCLLIFMVVKFRSKSRNGYEQIASYYDMDH